MVHKIMKCPSQQCPQTTSAKTVIVVAAHGFSTEQLQKLNILTYSNTISSRQVHFHYHYPLN